MKPTGIYAASLCWFCAKACGGKGCSWVDLTPSGHYPIEGWVAETREQRMSSKPEPQKVFIVKECPLYESEVEEE